MEDVGVVFIVGRQPATSYGSTYMDSVSRTEDSVVCYCCLVTFLGKNLHGACKGRRCLGAGASAIIIGCTHHYCC